MHPNCQIIVPASAHPNSSWCSHLLKMHITINPARKRACSSQGEGYHLNHNQGLQQGHSPRILERGNHPEILRKLALQARHSPHEQGAKWFKRKHPAYFWSFYNQFCSTVTQGFFVLTLMPLVKIIMHVIHIKATKRTTNICNLIYHLNKPLIFF